jgi:hypothetical protein
MVRAVRIQTRNVDFAETNFMFKIDLIVGTEIKWDT